MEKQFVTYEIALKLKELGFNEECLGSFRKENLDICRANIHYCNNLNRILAPLWQQAIDWLREKYNIYIDIKPVVFDTEPIYIFEIIDLKKGILLNNINESFIDPVEAREQSILKALELCQKEGS